MTRATRTTWLLLLLSLLSCRSERRGPEPERERRWSAPADDVGARCSDVGSGRVCWSADCPAGICSVRRAVPSAPPATRSGYRCHGTGQQRTCIDRALGAGRFVCSAEQCSQREPRLPDDGEWTCHDSAGAVVCREVPAAAAVAPASPDPAFVCDETPGGRVCVDFSPDLPDAEQEWRCRFEHEPRLIRVCRAGAEPGALGARCDAARPCVDGARCTAGRCAPEAPEPACLFDTECASGACRFGSCRGDGA